MGKLGLLLMILPFVVVIAGLIGYGRWGKDVGNNIVGIGLAVFMVAGVAFLAGMCGIALE
jgi:hypothetical protein